MKRTGSEKPGNEVRLGKDSSFVEKGQGFLGESKLKASLQ